MASSGNSSVTCLNCYVIWLLFTHHHREAFSCVLCVTNPKQRYIRHKKTAALTMQPFPVTFIYEDKVMKKADLFSLGSLSQGDPQFIRYILDVYLSHDSNGSSIACFVILQHAL